MGFVGRPEDADDGKPLRTYRGKPSPLGVLTEWTCPSCRQKVERRFEEGCPHCGQGVPGNHPPPITVTPHPAAPPTEYSRQPDPDRPGPQGSRMERPVEGPGLVVTRIIQYICKPGQEQAMLQGLQRGLVGRYEFAWGHLLAAIVDEVIRN